MDDIYIYNIIYVDDGSEHSYIDYVIIHYTTRC